MRPPTGPDLSALPPTHLVARLVLERAEDLPRQRVVAVTRSVLAQAREDVRAGSGPAPSAAQAADVVERRLRGPASTLVPCLNATGVLVHTNLGRSPLSERAVRAVVDAAGYVPLEIDPRTGRRGARTHGLTTLLATVCGAEAALAVNNAAGALMLALAAVAAPERVAVGRGELVEIGGGFRLPDVMTASGCELLEVGTTNRTYARDFDDVGDQVAMILSVHPSNFDITGFSTRPTGAELAAVAARHGIPFVHDVGSGLLGAELPGEVEVGSALRAGADLVIFSGDKLLGGPQAGCIVGRADLVARCARHPLARALRIDKLCAAGLEATLRAHAEGVAADELPLWQMLRADPDILLARSRGLAAEIPGAEVVQDAARIGGGTTSDALTGPVVAVAEGDPERLAARLRQGTTPVLARVHRDRLHLDLRSVPPDRDADLLALVLRALGPDPT